MQSIIKSFFLALTLISTASCKKFFDIEPAGVIVADNYYSNEKEAFQGLVGVYDVLQQRNRMYDLALWQLIDGGTDNIMGNTGNQPINNYAFGPDQAQLRDTWRALYDGIHRANLLLDNLERSSTIPDSISNRIRGEAKFLRALFYFNLVNLWGGVPLVDKALSPQELALPRSSIEEIYAFIESDLTFASQHLPLRQDLKPAETGRISAGAAKGLLSRAYLHQKKWNEAAQIAQEVIQSGQYELLPDYLNVFREENENNKEILFSVKFSPLDGETQLFSQWLEPQGYGQSVPTDDLVNAFEPDDKRKNPSIILTGDFIINPGFRVVSAGYVLKPGESVDPDFVSRNGGATFKRKWWGNKLWTKNGWMNIIAPVDNTLDIPLLRFAEVILNKAEALAEMGKLDSAIKEINKIRMRAGLPDVATKIDVSDQTALIKLIRNERRVELVNECTRMFDLRRWGILIEKLTLLNKPVAAPKNLFYPIPQVEIDLHKGAMQQNPGW